MLTGAILVGNDAFSHLQQSRLPLLTPERKAACSDLRRALVCGTVKPRRQELEKDQTDRIGRLLTSCSSRSLSVLGNSEDSALLIHSPIGRRGYPLGLRR